MRGVCDGCVYGELCGGVADRGMNGVDNCLICNGVFLPRVCRALVPCADFKAILTPFFTSLSTAEARVCGVKFIGLYGTDGFIAIRDFSF